MAQEKSIVNDGWILEKRGTHPNFARVTLLIVIVTSAVIGGLALTQQFIDSLGIGDVMPYRPYGLDTTSPTGGGVPGFEYSTDSYFEMETFAAAMEGIYDGLM